MDSDFDQQAAWFATPLGQRFVADEQAVVAGLLDTVFGEHLVQIGQWYVPETFLAHARTQKKTLVDWRPGTGADALMQPNRLAIAADSVDVVILPHTLELVPSPHALLREVGRVLRADGHLIVLSFEANGLWGMRHLIARHGYPCAQKQLIRERRLRDWLELLSFAVGPAQRYCHTLPLSRFAWFGRAPEEAWAARWLPFLRAGTCVAAQKRVLPMTPLRNRWRAPRLRVVSGLVEPTTRNAPRSKAP
jgi:SAM-dependent methyltransferase